MSFYSEKLKMRILKINFKLEFQLNFKIKTHVYMMNL